MKSIALERAVRDKQGNSKTEQTQLVERLARSAAEMQPQALRMLADLVQIESPSDDKSGVDRAVALVAGWCESLHGRIKVHRQKEFGDLLEVSFRPPRSGAQKPVMLLGHLDTVWKMGTLATMPWSVSETRVSGPGVLDMKGGVVMALTAMWILQEQKALSRPVTLLLHSDEEVGSPVSRPVTEKVARECEAVYVLEPAQGEQAAYKTARKGVGHYRLDVTGVAAHSGVDFAAGRSAVVELARQIERISDFTDVKHGITVNPGVIGGGTRSNVIAAEAWTEIDVRVVRNRDVAWIDKAFRRLRAHDRGCTLQVSGGLNRPPMERTAGTVALFRRAQKFTAMMGFPLEEASTGGGSDGNFTSALGVPTLDGMGAVGAGAHADHEHLLPQYLAPRTALLAAMLL
jgi:glutamate carboxypeptidase